MVCKRCGVGVVEQFQRVDSFERIALADDPADPNCGHYYIDLVYVVRSASGHRQENVVKRSPFLTIAEALKELWDIIGNLDEEGVAPSDADGKRLPVLLASYRPTQGLKDPLDPPDHRAEVGDRAEALPQRLPGSGRFVSVLSAFVQKRRDDDREDEDDECYDDDGDHGRGIAVPTVLARRALVPRPVELGPDPTERLEVLSQVRVADPLVDGEDLLHEAEDFPVLPLSS